MLLVARFLHISLRAWLQKQKTKEMRHASRCEEGKQNCLSGLVGSMSL